MPNFLCHYARIVGLSIRLFGDDVRYDPRPYTMDYPGGEPNCRAGEYPGDDTLFPVIWQREGFAANP